METLTKTQLAALPRDTMKKVVIAFDIDGTLRCNCTSTCQDPNLQIVRLARILATFKNVKVIAWSGGGKEYTETMVRRLKLDDVISPARCHSKLNYFMKHGKPDIAIDDIQETALANINLIVREK